MGMSKAMNFCNSFIEKRGVFCLLIYFIINMSESVNEPIIVSASRTKDMVHRSPDVLARLLLGKSECRWGPYAPFGLIKPNEVHTIVLWTKNPDNILDHKELNEALWCLKRDFRVQIALQVTATGFGSSFIEPGIPHWKTVVDSVMRIFQSGLIRPEAAVFRFDPFLQVKTPAGNRISNFTSEIFKSIAAQFKESGIKRVTTSRADAIHYPKVAERCSDLGLQWEHIDDERATSFCRDLDRICQSMSINFSICCEPNASDLLKWGCIDGRFLNDAKGSSFPETTTIMHNVVGKQRPTCRCTYSRDIGYSTGSKTCYSGGFGCLYCYSQGSAQFPDKAKISTEIAEFDRDPEEYLQSRDLHPALFHPESI